MAQVKCTGFIVHFDGDPTVGIFPKEWSISGDFTFEDRFDFDIFKKRLCEAFEYCSDTPLWAESLEERSKNINAEIAHLGAHHSV